MTASRIEMTTVFATKAAPFFTAIGRVEARGSRRAAFWTVMVGPNGAAGPVQVRGSFRTQREAADAARAILAA